MKKETYLSVAKQLNFTVPNTASILQVIFNFSGFIIAFTLLSYRHWAAYIASQILIAIFMNHAYLIVHECSHGSFVSRRKWNDLVGHLFGILAMIPFRVRQKRHMHHHEWTQHVDHEAPHKRALALYREAEKKPLLRQVIESSWRNWVPLLVINEHLSFWTVPLKKGETCKAERFSVLLTGAGLIFLCLLMGINTLLLIVPGILLYHLLVEITNLPHHLSAPIYGGKKKRLWEQDALTHSCAYIPVISPVLLLNFNYHTEHHLFPTLPWSQLPKANALLQRHEECTGEAMHELAWNRRNRRRPFRQIVESVSVLSDSR